MNDIQERVYSLIDKWEKGDIILSLEEASPIIEMQHLHSDVYSLLNKEYKAVSEHNLQEAIKLSAQRRSIMIRIVVLETTINRNLPMENQ